MVQGLVGYLLLPRELLATRLLGWHEDRHLGQRKRPEAQILQQPAPSRSGIRRRVSDGLLMDATSRGVAEEEDDEQGIHSQDVFDGVVFFLAALTRGLFSRVLGADDAPLRPVMGTRGEAGVAAGTATTGARSSSSGTTTVAAAASVTPSRWTRAVRERAGAAPRARSAASNAGNRTWIH